MVMDTRTTFFLLSWCPAGEKRDDERPSGRRTRVMRLDPRWTNVRGGGKFLNLPLWRSLWLPSHLAMRGVLFGRQWLAVLYSASTYAVVLVTLAIGGGDETGPLFCPPWAGMVNTASNLG